MGTKSESESKPVQSSIAIVGMACEFPGAHSPEELWENVLAGRRYFRKAPPERLPPEYFNPDPKAPDKSYCDRMAVISGWEFDPFKFRIPPVTFRASDIAHWLALYVADAAVRNSGVDLSTVDRSRAAVVLGNTLTGEFNRSHYLRLRWPYAEKALRRSLHSQGVDGETANNVLAAFRQSYEAPLPESSEDTLAGNMANTISGRISNYFDLGGGSFTVDGACSSALLSIVIAADALRDNRLDVALAGGVGVSLDPFEIIGFAKAQALAREDIRPYDERANGMLTGEGCGVFVLMREADARARQLTIHALLKGWAFASDGKGAITAPDVEGQRRTLRKVYAQAGYPMSSVGLVEGHGTGTPLGDKVELQAVHSVLGESAESVRCAIGSIKANIGHCKAAAGAAGLVKAINALKHKILPPTVNCERPSLLFAQSGWKLRPSLKVRAWEKAPTPRRASVSGMGFGGANAHVTLEEANPEAPPTLDHLRLTGTHQASELITLSAETLDALQAQVTRLLPIARKICLAELTDLSAALTKRPSQGPFRLAFVVSTPWELAGNLELVQQELRQAPDIGAINDPENGIFAGHTVEDPTMVALFPGQGSQRLNMADRFRERFPFVEDLFELERGHSCPPAAAIAPFVFRDTLGLSDEQIKAWESELRETRHAQPAIVASSIAALQALDHFGLRPAIAIGHSLGEITALHAAGRFDASTAVRIAALRGDAMASLSLPDPGAMLAVADTPAVVAELIHAADPTLVISNYNSPRQTVVSGPTKAIQALKARCEQDQIRCSLLPVSHAFHSDIVAPAATAFRKALHQLPQPSDPNPQLACAVISTASGQLLPSQQDLLQLLSDHIRQPVRFLDAVRHAAEKSPHLWIEVGPGGVLTALVRETIGPSAGASCPMDLRGEDAMHLLNQLLARAFVLGFPVRLENLFANRFHRPFDPKNYNPVFITNPCERPVEMQAQAPLSLSAAPLRQPQQPPISALETPALSPQTEVQPETLLDFATRWISKRTGIPLDKITPQQKLRDDLGLDSIKVGELVLNLSDKANRAFAGDPAMFANAPLGDMVRALDAIQPQALKQDTARRHRLDTLGTLQSLDHWVRSFRMAPVLYPPEEEEQRPLPASGNFFIFADPTSTPARALAESLTKRGFKATVSDPSILHEPGEPPSDLTGVIIFLPQQEKPFYACTPDEFTRRVEGTSEKIFRLFRWVGQNQQRDWSALRALAVRQVATSPDPAPDLDAGAAFLKSLRLEHPGASPKWISLPAEWDPRHTAQTILAELETSSERVARHYAPDGRRSTDVALPLAEPTGQAPQLGPEDVVVVTGGAKGITAELALGLGNLTKARLALFGSSPPPAPDANPQRNEIAANLKRFKEAGLTCAYFQCDVTSAEAVRTAVAKAESQLGTITAILHGAGISKVQPLDEKPLTDFLDCIRVKAAGLYNLLACIPPQRLKMLHVISSVLGKTGMRGQVDYTLANAWLDGAVRSVQSAFPQIHCLALGYSVWQGAGLGHKLGALDYLLSIGVEPISVDEGVAEYLHLLSHARSDLVFVTTGNLTAPLEAILYPAIPQAQGRFLERVRRWVPETEVCADATLSHQTDLYLPEHVYYGTPLFPGVMAIEAMVQAANACMVTAELPVLRNIEFHRPLVVPEDKPIVIRTTALADARRDGARRVRVVIRSAQDNFQTNHFAAECWYGLPHLPADGLPELPPLSEPLPLNPEDLHPVPLFQGKLFRRIESILKKTDMKESLTRAEVPRAERYFSDRLPAAVLTPSPALRDACLQSGAIVLPPGCLPERISELRFAGRPPASPQVLCLSHINPISPNKFEGRYSVFTENGEFQEQMTGLTLGLPQGTPLPPQRAASSIPLTRVPSDTTKLLPELKHTLVIVPHSLLDSQPELQRTDIPRTRSSVSPPRQQPAMGALVATRRAAAHFAQAHLRITLPPTQVAIRNQPSGKPELHFADGQLAQAFTGIDISLADAPGLSVALVGRGRLGIDLEPVEPRNAETWSGLLGDDGYALALQITRHTHDHFDAAATRVWTIIEAAKKATDLRKVVPVIQATRGDTWYSFSAATQNGTLEILSGLAASEAPVIALALAVLPPPPVQQPSQVSLSRNLGFEEVLSGMKTSFTRLAELTKNDPDSPDTDSHFLEFEAMAARLVADFETATSNDSVPERRKRQQCVYDAIKPFLGTSIAYARCLNKPLGYPGDYLMADRVFYKLNTATGLGYHFDRLFLAHPGCEAVRQRCSWVIRELLELLRQKPDGALRIMDLGCGAMAIENDIKNRLPPGKRLEIIAVDYDKSALEFAKARLVHPRLKVSAHQINLLSTQAATQIQELAKDADAIVSMGLIEYFSDETAHMLLRAIRAATPPGTTLLLGNFHPDHPSRSSMEWVLDWWLVYRTEADFKRLLAASGFDQSAVTGQLDPTGSYVLVKFTSK